MYPKNIPASVDWTGGLYCGVILDFEYKHKHITLSMLVYVEGSIHEYQHKIPTRPHHVPHKWKIPDYEDKTQWTDKENNKPILPHEGGRKMFLLFNSS